MRTRSIIRFLCLAIVASFSSLSSAQQAVSFAVSESGFVPTTSEQKLKIAVLMPQVDNPLTVFANSIVNGIKALQKYSTRMQLMQYIQLTDRF